MRRVVRTLMKGFVVRALASTQGPVSVAVAQKPPPYTLSDWVRVVKNTSGGGQTMTCKGC